MACCNFLVGILSVVTLSGHCGLSLLPEAVVVSGILKKWSVWLDQNCYRIVFQQCHENQGRGIKFTEHE